VTELALPTPTLGLSPVLGSFGTAAGTSTSSILPELAPSVSSKATPEEPAGQLTSAAIASAPVALGSSVTSAAARPWSRAPQVGGLPGSGRLGSALPRPGPLFWVSKLGFIDIGDVALAFGAAPPALIVFAGPPNGLVSTSTPPMSTTPSATPTPDCKRLRARA